MEPDLPSGTYALVRRHPQYKTGDTVLADHPRYGRIVKRIVGTEATGFRLAGINPASVSSHDLGALPPDRILGKLVWTVRPPTSSTASAPQEVS